MHLFGSKSMTAAICVALCAAAVAIYFVAIMETMARIFCMDMCR